MASVCVCVCVWGGGSLKSIDGYCLCVLKSVCVSVSQICGHSFPLISALSPTHTDHVSRATQKPNRIVPFLMEKSTLKTLFRTRLLGKITLFCVSSWHSCVLWALAFATIPILLSRGCVYVSVWDNTVVWIDLKVYVCKWFWYIGYSQCVFGADKAQRAAWRCQQPWRMCKWSK